MDREAGRVACGHRRGLRGAGPDLLVPGGEHLEGLGREVLGSDSGVTRGPLPAPVWGRGAHEREGRQDGQGEAAAAPRASRGWEVKEKACAPEAGGCLPSRDDGLAPALGSGTLRLVLVLTLQGATSEHPSPSFCASAGKGLQGKLCTSAGKGLTPEIPLGESLVRGHTSSEPWAWPWTWRLSLQGLCSREAGVLMPVQVPLVNTFTLRPSEVTLLSILTPGVQKG